MRTFTLAIVLAALCFITGWAISRYLRTASSAPGQVVAAQPCDLALAGSNTIGERLAPAIVQAFFEARGYAVAAQPAASHEASQLIAEKEGQRCVIDIRSAGSGHAFEELRAGSAAIGMASRAIRDGEIDQLREAGAGDFQSDSELSEHVVAFDGIAIITHPSRNLSRLSRDQVRRIFLGQISDWRQLGQPAGRIQLYARDDASGTFQFFLEHVLNNDPLWERAAAGARRFASSSELVSGLAGDPNGLGFVGAAYVADTVRALDISSGGPAFAPSDENVRSESYPISRRLYLYVRPQTMRENALVSELVAYFKSPDAFSVVEDLHYVSLRAAPAPAPVAAVGGPTLAEGEACIAGTAESEIYRRVTTGGRRMSSVIRFRPRSNVIDSLARDDLTRIIPILEDQLRQGGAVRLIGHTDSEGDAVVNRRIAMDRAEAARAALEIRGVLGVQVDSAGEQCPIASNDDEAGRQSNRRVEIWIVGS